MDFEPLYIATLVCGLRGYSRLKKELSGINYTEDELIQAKICDNLSILIWLQTKDAQTGRNYPHMILDEMLGKSNESKIEQDVFDSIDEFNEARIKALMNV